MEITTTVRSVLDRKPGPTWSIATGITVFEAISEMSNRNIGALPVVRDGRLAGMVSERDYTRKVVLLGRSSRETRVEEIMTVEPITVSLQDSIEKCMQLMTEYRVRHLPVVDADGGLLGIVSIGDCVNWMISAQSAAIEDLEHYVTGAYPG